VFDPIAIGILVHYQDVVELNMMVVADYGFILNNLVLVCKILVSDE